MKLLTLSLLMIAVFGSKIKIERRRVGEVFVEMLHSLSSHDDIADDIKTIEGMGNPKQSCRYLKQNLQGYLGIKPPRRPSLGEKCDYLRTFIKSCISAAENERQAMIEKLKYSRVGDTKVLATGLEIHITENSHKTRVDSLPWHNIELRCNGETIMKIETIEAFRRK